MFVIDSVRKGRWVLVLEGSVLLGEDVLGIYQETGERVIASRTFL